MQIIFSWPSSAIRFFLQKKFAGGLSMPQPTMHLGRLGSWYFLQKMVERQIKSGMVTGCKIKHLKMIYRGKSGKTGKKVRFQNRNTQFMYEESELQHAGCSTLTLSSRTMTWILIFGQIRSLETHGVSNVSLFVI